MGVIAKKYLKIYVQNIRAIQKIQPECQDIVFLNRNGKRLTRQMIFTLIRSLALKANIQKKIGPHTYDVDYKIGYPRSELKCNKCGGHLGHMFSDGPKNTTGKRH